MKKLLAALIAILSGAAVAAQGATLSVDWRGLPNVEGVLRDNSKSHYGFVNFVAFGPGWQYVAQDYAAKEHRKESIEDPALGRGLLFTGKIQAGSSKLAIREEFYDASKDGEDKTHVRWTISTLDNAPMNLERAYIRFPLALSDFAGGTVGAATLPAEFGDEWIGCGDKRDIRIVSADGKKALRVAVQSGNAVIQDARKDKQDRFELRIEFPDQKQAQSSTIEFDVWAKPKLDVPPPPLKLAANAEWVEYPFTNDIKPGSILDFSGVVAPVEPAGQHGFARVSKAGHFEFEKRPGKPVRFVGGNLCFDANFLSKEQVDAAVGDFVRRGWNTIRFHHIDVTITKDEWNDIWARKSYPEISPERLDQLDYFLAQLKKAGIYVTFDLYAMGSLGSCEGFDKPLNSNTVKAVVPIHKPAEDQWFRRAMEIFDHLNPYTGMKWKDDPAVLFVTLLNEDSINSVWWGAADLYVAKYNERAKAKGHPNYDAKGIGKKREFAEFLFEVKADANRRMARRLRDAGVKTLVSGGNWWDTMQQAYERDALDVVDNHGYGDHPQPSYSKLPFHVNQTSNVKLGNPTYGTPMMKAPTRVLGKPFAVTEYNYCPPNKFRNEGGLVMGAYSALQDWDAIYRFAWSHARSVMERKQYPIGGFDIARDPVAQLTERQITLLFGRGDVRPAEKVYGFGVDKDAAFRDGLGDMWARNLFPHPFTQLGYISRIGSFISDDGGAPALACTKTWTAATKNEIPVFAKRGVSDTGEVSIDCEKGDLTVATPKTAAVYSLDKRDLAAGPLAVKGATTSCSVSASAMDGKDLVSSKKILLFHITDVQNTDQEFTNDKMTDTKSWGRLPYLARAGKAEVELKSDVAGLRLSALKSDGTVLRVIPAIYQDGVYRFSLEIKSGVEPTMIYSLTAE